MPRFLAPLFRLVRGAAPAPATSSAPAAAAGDGGGGGDGSGDGRGGRGDVAAPPQAPHPVPAGWEDKNCPAMQPELQPTGLLGGFIPPSEVSATVKAYVSMHEANGGSLAARRAAYAELTNRYYDLVTSFYEYGWGQSFHFGRLEPGLPLRDALAKHERALAASLKVELFPICFAILYHCVPWAAVLSSVERGRCCPPPPLLPAPTAPQLMPEDRVLDLGCGVGGPLRQISAFTGAFVTGLNNNAYQLRRAAQLNARYDAGQGCDFLLSDFMCIQAADGSFDAAYAIEATCHAPDATGCFREARPRSN